MLWRILTQYIACRQGERMMADFKRQYEYDYQLYFGSK